MGQVSMSNDPVHLMRRPRDDFGQIGQNLSEVEVWDRFACVQF